MNSQEELNATLSVLYDSSQGLPPEDQDRLIEILARLARLIRQHDLDDVGRVNALRQIAVYVAKKNKETVSSHSDSEEVSLRKLRSLILHGKLSSRNRTEMRAYESAVWRAILRSADRWHSVELSNFLAYCIGVPEVPVDFEKVKPKRIINLYRSLFNELEERHRARAFEELVMRLYSDPHMREILE